MLILKIAIGTAVYLLIGAAIAFLDALYDMIRGRYSKGDTDAYIGIAIAWIVLVFFGIIYAPCWLFTKFLNHLNDVIQQIRN